MLQLLKEREWISSLPCSCLAGTRFAVEAYVHWVRDRSVLEAVASSLTELFSPQIISERLSGMLSNYDYLTRETMAYFQKRPPQATRDADFALEYAATLYRRRPDEMHGDGSADQ